MVMLDRSVRRVMLQFSFSNPEVIPISMRRKTQSEPLLFDRKTRPNGTLVIIPTEKCSLADFIRELEMSGYEMVDAFYRKRIDSRDSGGKKKYHMVRFIFVRHEFSELSDEFINRRNVVQAELRSICSASLWRVKLFKNKFYKDDREVNGQYALSINMDARQPLLCHNGQPVTVWQKDNSGNRIGKTPLPLKAKYYLRVDGKIITLQAA